MFFYSYGIIFSPIVPLPSINKFYLGTDEKIDPRMDDYMVAFSYIAGASQKLNCLRISVKCVRFLWYDFLK